MSLGNTPSISLQEFALGISLFSLSYKSDQSQDMSVSVPLTSVLTPVPASLKVPWHDYSYIGVIVSVLPILSKIILPQY